MSRNTFDVDNAIRQAYKWVIWYLECLKAFGIPEY